MYRKEGKRMSKVPNKRRFTKYPRHADNIGEIISAEDVNQLQREIEDQQRDIYDLRDVDFEKKTLFVLENHPVVNSMLVDKLDDDNNINKELMNHVMYSENERAVAFHKDSTLLEDSIEFDEIVHRKGLPIAKVLLMVDDYKPNGTDIEYQVSNNGVDYYTIEPNQSQVLKVPHSGARLRLRAVFKRNEFTVSPRLDAWALLYEDTSYSVNLFDGYFDFGDAGEGKQDDIKHYHSHHDLLDVGPDDHHPQEHSHDGTDGSGTISHNNLTDIGPDDHHPKNHRHGFDGVDPVDVGTDIKGVIGYPHLPQTLWTGFPGPLRLYRNPEQEPFNDTLVRAKGPDEDTYLIFDDEGYLMKVVTIFREVATIEYLLWDDYEYADGMEMRTLMGTDKEIKDIQDEEVQQIRNEIMATQTKPPMPPM